MLLPSNNFFIVLIITLNGFFVIDLILMGPESSFNLFEFFDGLMIGFCSACLIVNLVKAVLKGFFAI